MILNLYVELKDINNNRSDRIFKYIDESNNKIIADGIHGIISSTPTTLNYENNKYIFKDSPKKMDRIMLHTKYPLCSKRKWTIGYNIESDTDKSISHYGEAIICCKRWIFKKNIGLDVMKIDDKHYKTYRVGFNEPWHYYCIHDAKNKTIAIIKRLYGEDVRAKIYIQKEEYLFPALLICTKEIVWGIYDEGDKSSGNYISIMNEEKEIFDKTFIEKVTKVIER